jgi:hypothetical protein
MAHAQAILNQYKGMLWICQQVWFNNVQHMSATQRDSCMVKPLPHSSEVQVLFSCQHLQNITRLGYSLVAAA